MKEINHPDLSKGTTMGVPYKAFAQPALLWNLIRRSICVAMENTRIDLDQTQAAAATAAIVKDINAFTNRDRFNAEGLKAEQTLPIDEVYQEWAQRSQYFLTLTDSADGNLSLTIGVQNKKPWGSLTIDLIHESFVQFYMNDKNRYVIKPVPVRTPIEGRFVPIMVAPFIQFTHASNHATGEVPSLISTKTLKTKAKDFSNEFAVRTRKEGFQSPVLVVHAHETEQPREPIQSVSEYLATQLTQYIERFELWNGGVGNAMTASFFGRLAPDTFTGDNVKYKLVCGVTFEGDYRLNGYTSPIWLERKHA